MGVASAWSQIDALLGQIVPGAVAALQAGATAKDVALLEDGIGLRMPDDLRASLEVHNGQAGPYMSQVLFDNQWLLPSSEIAATWRTRTEVAESLVKSGDYTAESIARWWDRACIPITESDGDGYCVHSETGAVFFFVHDDGMKGPVVLSVTEWLESIASALDAKRYRVELECVWLDDLFTW
jgi:cell wall assembly regulator SMI1